jgi:hypothetical protein
MVADHSLRKQFMLAPAVTLQTALPALLFEMDRAVRASWNAQAVEIAFAVIDYGLAVDQGQGTVRAHLDALSGTAAFFQIDDDFHGHSLSRLNDFLESMHRFTGAVQSGCWLRPDNELSPLQATCYK